MRSWPKTNRSTRSQYTHLPSSGSIGQAGFGGGFYGIRRLAERDHRNIVHWSTYDLGGHFAAHEAANLYVNDIRQFFRGLR